ncbi:hypothetical protein [Modestobacter lacusdianchii]
MLFSALTLLVLAAVVLVTVLVSRDGEGVAPGPSGDDGQDPQVPESARLTWAPPTLDAPLTVNVTAEDTSLRLQDDRDYRIVLPEDGLKADGGLVIKGGHDVVLIGGRIEAEERALYLIDQTGTVHIEGLSIGGDGLLEGINLDQRKGATVQLENIHVDMVTGEEDANHADLIQTWAGPSTLRIDGFTGNTGYQGFFLLPFQFGDVQIEEWDFRRVTLTGTDDAAYLMWTEDEAPWLSVQDVTVVPATDKDRDQLLEGDLDDVAVGASSTTADAPAGEPGVDYESPGYAGD